MGRTKDKTSTNVLWSDPARFFPVSNSSPARSALLRTSLTYSDQTCFSDQGTLWPTGTEVLKADLEVLFRLARPRTHVRRRLQSRSTRFGGYNIRRHGMGAWYPDPLTACLSWWTDRPSFSLKGNSLPKRTCTSDRRGMYGRSVWGLSGNNCWLIEQRVS